MPYSKIVTVNCSLDLGSLSSAGGTGIVIPPPLPPQIGPIITGSVLSLLHGEGIDTGQVITDETGLTWTPNTHDFSGSLTHPATSLSQFKFGESSIEFDASAYMTAVLPETLAVNFTVECWVKLANPADGNYNTIFAFTNGSSTQTLSLQVFVTGQVIWNEGSVQIEHETILSADTWHHVALVCEDSIFHIYVDGVGTLDTASALTVLSIVDPVPVIIGKHPRITSPSSQMLGITPPAYLDELRVVNNQAVYTADFTPATAPFNL